MDAEWQASKTEVLKLPVQHNSERKIVAIPFQDLDVREEVLYVVRQHVHQVLQHGRGLGLCRRLERMVHKILVERTALQDLTPFSLGRLRHNKHVVQPQIHCPRDREGTPRNENHLAIRLQRVLKRNNLLRRDHLDNTLGQLLAQQSLLCMEHRRVRCRGA